MIRFQSERVVQSTELNCRSCLLTPGIGVQFENETVDAKPHRVPLSKSGKIKSFPLQQLSYETGRSLEVIPGRGMRTSHCQASISHSIRILLRESARTAFRAVRWLSHNILASQKFGFPCVILSVAKHFAGMSENKPEKHRSRHRFSCIRRDFSSLALLECVHSSCPAPRIDAKCAGGGECCRPRIFGV